MIDIKKIIPVGHQLDAMVLLPGSKSVTNRALLLSACCVGETVLGNVLESEDTRIMIDGLRKLGVSVEYGNNQKADKQQIIVTGLGGKLPVANAEIYIGNSGTSVRFLTALLALSGSGEYRLHGKTRMHQRPISDLVDTLRLLGGNIRYENDNGSPPLLIGCRKELDKKIIESGTIKISVSGDVSSQFLSAILMTIPIISSESDVVVEVTGNLVSRPYVGMTVNMIKSFGVNPIYGEAVLKTEKLNTAAQQRGAVVQGRSLPPIPAPVYGEDFKLFRFRKGEFYSSPQFYWIEPDASAASYFFAAAAICGGKVQVNGLSQKSMQGDIKFVNCLEQMGCDVVFDNDQNTTTVSRPLNKPLQGISVDMNSISDTAQTLGVVALFANGTTEIKNIEHARYKETDRIADLATELRKFGATIDEQRDGLKITPPKKLQPATIETYDDHRMAMSFSIAGLKVDGVIIKNPDCVQKTFPNFFEELQKL
ncbi:MAG: 3-phosphoshikimate 1-carboxyvinyltransferase [Planctomycetaceae bacterium]|jgi:3-phosphoshikimate 1-carboxyvinyltransferase|nr:3-phosphoshikimate 1-carboxyvinyltransferase [Planctomycetaceae bacterium]